ncbi:MAG: phenylalanine--tRNA ligase subunit alpha [Spiroplasma sp.]|nr:phenylalanine--tRNA ligase subunit alpha [Mycoplasmatales bacterium]
MKIKIEEFKVELNEIKDANALQDLKVKYLGKKGLVNDLMAKMKHVENKKEYGQSVNDLKQKLDTFYNEKKDELEQWQLEKKLKDSAIDVSLPSRQAEKGTQSILIKTAREIEDIFTKMGFEIAIGQEVESDFHNFEALNLDKNHPARDMQDTFYIDPVTLLRTHTSNIQSRTLSTNIGKEFKIICPGKVYRRDDDDSTHSHQFFQVDGLVVVKKDSNHTASLQDLKTTLTIFANEIFDNDKLEIRMRPSFFPFTEPGVEIDVTCSSCLGEGCGFCKKTGWIEVLGAGVIHKNVFEIAGYDPELYTGFAFGIGVERIALLKYNIEDIRNFYQNDLRFIKQFN